MSPHANGSEQNHDRPGMSEWTGYGDEDVSMQHTNGDRYLQRYNDDEIHDLICVGFGPASLAIAVALYDALEAGGFSLRNRNPKVRFLERQSQFSWHAGMLLPGTRMQITFIKDLATLRNPRSKFTFLNYLHQQGRLVPFTNLGTFLPQRIEYEDYMRWCAGHFEDVVDYNQHVEGVGVGHVNDRTGVVEYFVVKSWNPHSKTYSCRRARHVIIAVGGKPNIPDALNVNTPRVIHSSQYATKMSEIFPPGAQPKTVAVIGAGQSAAEVFNSIPSRFPNAKSYLLIKGSALRPSDDSPFVNEIFDPDRIDAVYSQEPKLRADAIAMDKATNYGVVRLELLEEIYSRLYSYRIQFENEDDWPQRILTHCSVTHIDPHPSASASALRLHIKDVPGTNKALNLLGIEKLDVDLVIVASGYKRDAHEDLLREIGFLMPNGQNGTPQCEVGRDYSVRFKDGSVASNAGVWLQGCNESTHGLSDTLLSVLATRSGEIVQNIFGFGKTP